MTRAGPLLPRTGPPTPERYSCVHHTLLASEAPLSQKPAAQVVRASTCMCRTTSHSRLWVALICTVAPSNRRHLSACTCARQCFSLRIRRPTVARAASATCASMSLSSASMAANNLQSSALAQGALERSVSHQQTLGLCASQCWPEVGAFEAWLWAGIGLTPDTQFLRRAGILQVPRRPARPSSTVLSSKLASAMASSESEPRSHNDSDSRSEANTL